MRLNTNRPDTTNKVNEDSAVQKDNLSLINPLVTVEPQASGISSDGRVRVTAVDTLDYLGSKLGNGLTNSQSEISVNINNTLEFDSEALSVRAAGVDHDSLLNFESLEHVPPDNATIIVNASGQLEATGTTTVSVTNVVINQGGQLVVTHSNGTTGIGGNVIDVQPDETDPVWNAEKVNYLTSTQINALPISTFSNDSGYLTSYTETDPVWLADKPSYYTSSQVNALPISTFNNDSGYVSLNSFLDQGSFNVATGNLGLKAGTQTQVNINIDGRYIQLSEKGQANGVATLGPGGLIPSSQLPAGLDEIEEYANFAAFPTTGQANIIYLDLDQNITYRWSGTQYTAINPQGVSTVFNRTGAVTAETGDYNTSQVSESGNLYFTEARARAVFSFGGSLTYDSATGQVSYVQPTNVSTFSNDAGYIARGSNIFDANSIVETDSSMNLQTVAKNTAHNKNFGSNTNEVVEGNDPRLLTVDQKNNVALTNQNNTFSGLQTFNDLTVTGAFTRQPVVDQIISDNLIELNAGETGSGVTALLAGSLVNRGLLPNIMVGFDERIDQPVYGTIETVDGDVDSVTTNTANLGTTASSVDDTYNTLEIKFFKADEDSFVTTITDYVGSTKIATLQDNLPSGIDNTWKWRILISESLNQIWHEGNDGENSGLDADLLDGRQGSEYALAADTHSAVTLTGENYLSLSGQEITANAIDLNASHTTGVLPISKGGTGTSTLNFVDLITSQTVAGMKSFSEIVMLNAGASMTSATSIPLTLLSGSNEVEIVMNGRAGNNSSTVAATLRGVITGATNPTATGELFIDVHGAGSSFVSYQLDSTGRLTTPNLRISGLNPTSGQILSVDANGVVSAIDAPSGASVESLSFDTSSGVLTLGRSGVSDLTQSLDGRYANTVVSTNFTAGLQVGGSDVWHAGNAGTTGFDWSARNIDTNGNINVVSGAYQLNGADINTTGTLTNVAYKGQDNAFTALQTMGAGLNVTGTLRGTNTEADNTVKFFQITTPHYDSSEEDVMGINLSNISTGGRLGYGGGSSSLNSVIRHTFFVGATGATTGGSERMVIDNSGVSVTGNITANNIINTRVVNIGGWNMDSTSSVNITIPSDIPFSNIIKVSAMIVDDAETSKLSLEFADDPDEVAGKITTNTNNVVLSRYLGRFFDNINYDNTSNNRGYIVIEYTN